MKVEKDRELARVEGDQADLTTQCSVGAWNRKGALMGKKLGKFIKIVV